MAYPALTRRAHSIPPLRGWRAANPRLWRGFDLLRIGRANGAAGAAQSFFITAYPALPRRAHSIPPFGLIHTPTDWYACSSDATNRQLNTTGKGGFDKVLQLSFVELCLGLPS